MTTDPAVRVGSLPGAALAVSLLMHAALLLLPIDASPRRAAATFPDRPAGTVLRLMLRPLAVASARHILPSHAPATTAARAAPPAAPARLARSARAASQASVEVPPPPVAPRDEPTPTALDPDALRARVRDAIRQETQAKAQSTTLPAFPAQRDAPTLLDRPVLDALARRVGRPLQVTREQRLADGSWRIRFAGGVCMHVPRELPVALDNAFGPNIAMTTNCSD